MLLPAEAMLLLSKEASCPNQGRPLHYNQHAVLLKRFLVQACFWSAAEERKQSPQLDVEADRVSAARMLRLKTSNVVEVSNTSPL